MKNKIIHIIFISFIFSSIINCATIEGIVTDFITSKPVVSADVLVIEFPSDNKIIESRYLATTNTNGLYILKDIPPGKYEIQIYKYYNESTFGAKHYRDFYDTLNIIDKYSIINVSVRLKHWAVYIDTVGSIENYHNYFKSLKRENILKIKLDSLCIRKPYWKLYSTFYNKTDSTIYLIKELVCFRIAEPIIKNSKGQIMKRNMESFDCMGKELPDSSDIIAIPPHDSASYSPVTLRFHNLYNYPIDTYSIKLEYKSERREKLPGAFPNPRVNWEKMLKKQIYYFNEALRGDYVSKDSLIFINSNGIAK